MTNKFICPVCGYTGLGEPAVDELGNGSYEICSSCRFEFGVTDLDRGFTFQAWRAKWVAEGMPWNSRGIKDPPADWNPAQQLANLLNGSS